MKTKFTKEEAYEFVKEFGHPRSHMVSLLLFTPMHKGHQAKRIKILACLVENGLNVDADNEQSVLVNNSRISWEKFDLVGNALKNDEINADQVKVLLKKLDEI